MRILVLATDAFGGYGGIARYNRDLARALAARAPASRASISRASISRAPISRAPVSRDFARARTPAARAGAMRVDILPRLAPEPEAVPAGVRQASPRRGKAAYAVTALAATAARRPGIIVNAHLYHTPLARLLCRASGARMISVLHGTEIWTPLPRRLLAPLAGSDIVLCVSRDTEARLLAQCPALQGRTAVTYNTVGGAFTPGSPAERAAARARYGVGGAFVVLTVARLDTRKGADGRPYKGHDRIIPLLDALPVDRPAVHLIAGIGEDRGRLEALARACGVSGRVRFLGKVEDADLPDLYRAADLFALPSTGEGFGIVYLEAMASGVPAVGLALGGAPDALSAHPLGMAVPAERFEAEFKRAAGIAMGLGDPERTQLSQAVRRRFGRGAFDARVDDVIERLIQHER